MGRFGIVNSFGTQHAYKRAQVEVKALKAARATMRVLSGDAGLDGRRENLITIPAVTGNLIGVYPQGSGK